MKRIVFALIFLLFCSNIDAEVKSHCENIQSLKEKIKDISNKDDLLNVIKKCSDNLKDEREFVIILTKAYLLNQNYLYAKNLLTRYYLNNPDCEIAGYIAYIDFMLKDKDALKESLSLCKEGDIKSEELYSRFALIKAISEERELGDIKGIYPEDYRLFLIYSAGHRELNRVNLRFKSGFGYTTNAFSSNPLDTYQYSDSDSTIADYSIGLGLKRVISDNISLGIDSELKGTKFFNNNGKFSPDNLSSNTIILIPAFEYTTNKMQTIIKYKFDTMFLNIDTEYESAPIQFFEGHRLELYMNFLNRYILFFGAGRRYFDEFVRGRWEYDGGVGYLKNLTEKAQLITLFTFRYYEANSTGYDDIGESFLLKLDYKIMRGLGLAQILSLSFDDFYNSTGYFKEAKIREDKLLRYNLEVQYEIWKYLSLYLSYTFSYRDSLIDTFNFNDHRIILGISLNLKNERRDIEIKYQYDFEKDYYKKKPGENNLQNLMEILKENESIQRGSQCKD
ncbi:MAG: hypothetical protein ACP5KG_03875 [Myxococcota bacterium]